MRAFILSDHPNLTVVTCYKLIYYRIFDQIVTVWTWGCFAKVG